MSACAFTTPLLPGQSPSDCGNLPRCVDRRRPSVEAMSRITVRREVATALLAAWLACWAAEEHALQAAARDHSMSPAAVERHLQTVRSERAQVRALLS